MSRQRVQALTGMPVPQSHRLVTAATC